MLGKHPPQQPQQPGLWAPPPPPPAPPGCNPDEGSDEPEEENPRVIIIDMT